MDPKNDIKPEPSIGTPRADWTTARDVTHVPPPPRPVGRAVTSDEAGNPKFVRERRTRRAVVWRWPLTTLETALILVYLAWIGVVLAMVSGPLTFGT